MINRKKNFKLDLQKVLQRRLHMYLFAAHNFSHYSFFIFLIVLFLQEGFSADTNNK